MKCEFCGKERGMIPHGHDREMLEKIRELETELEREKALTQGFVDRWGTERTRAEKAEARVAELRKLRCTVCGRSPTEPHEGIPVGREHYVREAREREESK